MLKTIKILIKSWAITYLCSSAVIYYEQLYLKLLKLVNYYQSHFSVLIIYPTFAVPEVAINFHIASERNIMRYGKCVIYHVCGTHRCLLVNTVIKYYWEYMAVNSDTNIEEKWGHKKFHITLFVYNDLVCYWLAWFVTATR